MRVRHVSAGVRNPPADTRGSKRVRLWVIVPDFDYANRVGKLLVEQRSIVLKERASLPA